MMRNQPDKTASDLVNRLALAANSIRWIGSSIGALYSGAFFAMVAGLLNRDLWWLGGILGLLAGYAAGLFTASVLTVVLDWMAYRLSQHANQKSG